MTRRPVPRVRHLKPYCGRCDDPRTRWRDNPFGKGVVRCFECWTPVEIADDSHPPLEEGES